MTNSKPFRLHPSERKTMLVLVDSAVLSLAILFSLWQWSKWDPTRFADQGALVEVQWYLLVPLWVVVSAAAGAYDHRVAIDRARVVRALLATLLVLGTLYLLVYFAAPRRGLPRSVVLLLSGTALAALCVWRLSYAALLTRASSRRRVIVVGAGQTGRAIADAIAMHASNSLELVGFVDDDPARQGQMVAGCPVLGPATDVASTASSQGVAEIVVAITSSIDPAVLKGFLALQELGVQITPMQLMYESLTDQVPVHHVGDAWYVALPLEHRQLRRGYLAVKRTLDCVIAVVGLIVFAILLPVLAVMIKMDSKGPVLYTQRRLGRNGRTFNIVKLRTMVVDAEAEGEARWSQHKDPRVTRAGRVLRATMLDEIPQLWNVLKGEMSVVGPRPERPELVALLEREVPYYRLRHAVSPGMAGWALVHEGYGRSPENALTKVQYDLYYIKHQSLWLDARIILRTMGRAVTFRRAERTKRDKAMVS